MMILQFTELEKHTAPRGLSAGHQRSLAATLKGKEEAGGRDDHLHSESSGGVGPTLTTAQTHCQCLKAIDFSFVETWECKNTELLRFIVSKWTGACLKDSTSVYGSLESTGGASVSFFPPSTRKIASLLNMSDIEQMSSCLCSAELLQ